MEGHILSVFPAKDATEFSINTEFPMLSLLVSGGHTELVLVNGIGNYALLGQTKDDAAGEAFDKVARMLGLPYPGGPEISKLAAIAREKNIVPSIKLPRPMLHTKDLDFSFSGLKTAVLYAIKKIPELSDEIKQEIALEFENSVVDVLVAKTLRAAEEHSVLSIAVGGGVAANLHLRKHLTEEAAKRGLSVSFPTKELSTDNAIMIGIAGYFGEEVDIDSPKLIAQGNMAL